MAKLTRYTNFESLKLDDKITNTTSIDNKQQVAELEEFVSLLRRELLIKKKTESSKITNGEQLSK